MASNLRQAPPAFLALRDRFDDVLRDFLRARRQELEWIDDASTGLVDEIARLMGAGGKRLRPAFCYWGYRATGAREDERILKAASAMELLHTMALIHDDLMDDASERRGVPSSSIHLAHLASEQGDEDPEFAGWSLAILVGDLSAVLADQLLLEAGFPSERLTRALDRYHRMRLEMAAGQYLDFVGEVRDPHQLAALKGGAYTVEGPLLVGATLAGATLQIQTRLQRYGEPLGQAFQLRDDLRDGEPGAVTHRDVVNLVSQAKQALDASVLDPDAVAALSTLADLVASS